MKEKAYRHGLVNAQIEIDLPFQIKALRKQRGWTQPELARRTEMKQPRISAMEKSGGANFSLETLKRLAEAFDVALVVRFAPFSDLLTWSDSFRPDEFEIPSFEDEMLQAEQTQQKARATKANTAVPLGQIQIPESWNVMLANRTVISLPPETMAFFKTINDAKERFARVMQESPYVKCFSAMQDAARSAASLAIPWTNAKTQATNQPEVVTKGITNIVTGDAFWKQQQVQKMPPGTAGNSCAGGTVLPIRA
ncbi:MAG: hypothetical protein QOJ99_2300 [Bryobacterales bacterium]|jgi:transcriptional regulator with XRE-family HTH domain|nr:hypothetical protein [Bryobacterales bacterium]